jgi:alpha-ketoglutarate-dependent taurine dioxygenase
VAFGQLVPTGPGQIFDPSRRVIPSWGANTEFADMRAAYDALDERTKAEVEDIVCEHSLIYSREAIGFNDLTPEEIAAFQPVRQPLVRTHPVTGGKSLFLASHAGAIVGWTIPEARMFLRDLTEHATQREFVYAHSWRPHDLVMWDNRTTRGNTGISRRADPTTRRTRTSWNSSPGNWDRRRPMGVGLFSRKCPEAGAAG